MMRTKQRRKNVRRIDLACFTVSLGIYPCCFAKYPFYSLAIKTGIEKYERFRKE